MNRIPALSIAGRFVALTLPVLLAAGCGGPPPEDDAPPAAGAPIETSVAAPTTVAEPLVASGGIEPFVRVAPGTKLLGRVAQVAVEEGERVVRGQLLALVEDRDLRAAVDQAEAAVEMAQARLVNASAQEARMVELAARGSVTRKNLEDATAELRIARAGVAQADADLVAARVQLGYARLESPIDGWVTAQRVETGDMTSPGRPLFEIEDLSRVKVAVEVNEAVVASVAPGDPVSVTVGGVPGEHRAEVHRVVPSADPESRTFTVKLILDNPEGLIKPGMFARALFRGPPREALLVPADALVRRGQLEGLFVVEEGRARLRWVRRGRLFEDGVEILSGLAAGERFVRRPAPGLADGAPVEERG